MSKKTFILLAIATFFLFIYLSFKLGYPTYSWHQKLTLEIETPDGIKAASTVNYVALRKVWTPAFLGYDRVYDFSGEALALELAPKKVLFVLLSGVNRPSQEGLAWGVFKDLVPGPPDPHGQVWFDGAQNISRVRETRVVPKDLYPLFLTFGDLNNPATFSIVDPDNLAATFGSGYSIRQMTLAITDEKLTEGAIDPYIPWSKWTTEKLLKAGNGISPMRIKTGEITHYLSAANFKWGKL